LEVVDNPPVEVVEDSPVGGGGGFASWRWWRIRELRWWRIRQLPPVDGVVEAVKRGARRMIGRWRHPQPGGGGFGVKRGAPAARRVWCRYPQPVGGIGGRSASW